MRKEIAAQVAAATQPEPDAEYTAEQRRLARAIVAAVRSGAWGGHGECEVGLLAAGLALDAVIEQDVQRVGSRKQASFVHSLRRSSKYGVDEPADLGGDDAVSGLVPLEVLARELQALLLRFPRAHYATGRVLVSLPLSPALSLSRRLNLLTLSLSPSGLCGG